MKCESCKGRGRYRRTDDLCTACWGTGTLCDGCGDSCERGDHLCDACKQDLIDEQQARERQHDDD